MDLAEVLLRMILVSACLAGIKCCYNGENALSSHIESLVRKKSAIPVCPEQIGGLSTPREPAEIVGGDGRDVLEGRARVLTRSGEDVTGQYIRGAEEVLKIAKMVGAKKVILKRNSPACGFNEIYHEGRLVNGNGVCSALLIKHEIEVEASGFQNSDVTNFLKAHASRGY